MLWHFSRNSFSNFWIRQCFWKFWPKSAKICQKVIFWPKNHVFWLSWSKFSKILSNSKIWKKKRRRFSNHESRLLSGSHTFAILVILDLKIHQSMWIHWPFFPKTWTKGHDPYMTFDPMSVEVTCVTLPKDHCVQVPWQYINVCGYSDQFLQITTYIHIHTYTYILRTEWVIT